MTDRSETITRYRRRSALTRIDFLLIAAVILTFAVTVSATVGRAKANHNEATVPAFTGDSANLLTKSPTPPA
jgi:hypothetical protein